MRKLHIAAQRAPACPDCGAVICDCAHDHLPVADTIPSRLDGLLTALTCAFLVGCAFAALWSV